MQCNQCAEGEMRLVRFDRRQEVFACRQCQAETLLLDCHYCERRTVRRLVDSSGGVARWSCHRCEVVMHKCPNCLQRQQQGWIVSNAILSKGQSGFTCQRCGVHWPSADKIEA
ncbi:hypothetical protein [Oceanicoccus sp. KOV_DT_Chl]|uniref:hypothetical protein n=1 Tax=Oceanicoccus sp. KOV_DT_Chl TaxID=1904639 RepID=UPI000C79ED80|nr:hypothetical protein [Oceanicoccus sp. KOV_DT_Chl]